MRSAVLLLLLATLGCATTKRASRASEFAPTPDRTGPLAELENHLQDALGADRSGFKLLDMNEDAALAAGAHRLRAALARPHDLSVAGRRSGRSDSHARDRSG